MFQVTCVGGEAKYINGDQIRWIEPATFTTPTGEKEECTRIWFASGHDLAVVGKLDMLAERLGRPPRVAIEGVIQTAEIDP